MEKLVFSLREVAAPLSRTQRSLEKLLNARTGRIDLGVGIINTIKIGGARVVARHEFERFLRDAGLVVEATPTANPEPTPEHGRRGRPRDAERRVRS